MRVKTWVTIDQEVEVDVPMEDVIAGLEADPELLLRSLSRFLSFLRSIPDPLIAQLTAEQRRIVDQVMSEQAERFKLIIPAPRAEV